MATSQAALRGALTKKLSQHARARLMCDRVVILPHYAEHRSKAPVETHISVFTGSDPKAAVVRHVIHRQSSKVSESLMIEHNSTRCADGDFFLRIEKLRNLFTQGHVR